jgi:hypothetical protein
VKKVVFPVRPGRSHAVELTPPRIAPPCLHNLDDLEDFIDIDGDDVDQTVSKRPIRQGLGIKLRIKGVRMPVRPSPTPPKTRIKVLRMPAGPHLPPSPTGRPRAMHLEQSTISLPHIAVLDLDDLEDFIDVDGDDLGQAVSKRPASGKPTIAVKQGLATQPRKKVVSQARCSSTSPKAKCARVGPTRHRRETGQP